MSFKEAFKLTLCGQKEIHQNYLLIDFVQDERSTISNNTYGKENYLNVVSMLQEANSKFNFSSVARENNDVTN